VVLGVQVVGDTLTFTASSCLTSGMRLNGRMTIRVTRGPYDPLTPVSSAAATLLRGGAPVGTVRQPRIAIDDVEVKLQRAF
jgi:hypothetical protein